MDFLNAPLPNESTERDSHETSQVASPVGGTHPSGPRSVVINITPEERAAVDRLKALGFSEELVVQVS